MTGQEQRQTDQQSKPEVNPHAQRRFEQDARDKAFYRRYTENGGYKRKPGQK